MVRHKTTGAIALHCSLVICILSKGRPASLIRYHLYGNSFIAYLHSLCVRAQVNNVLAHNGKIIDELYARYRRVSGLHEYLGLYQSNSVIDEVVMAFACVMLKIALISSVS